MEVVNEWFRLHDDKFIHAEGRYMFGYDKSNNKTHIGIHGAYNKIIKKAYEPQGLIKNGDLVTIKGYKGNITVVVNEVCGDELYVYGAGHELEFNTDNVIEVYTKDKDDSFVLRWSEKNS